jgi:hypothetical protein
MNEALYAALASRDFENCQNLLMNMGLIQQDLHALAWPGALQAAYGCYSLGLFCTDAFGFGADSAWDAILVGELWLAHPDQRASFQDVLTSGRLSPASAGFYVQALKHAQRLGEARQVALCAINLWCFATESVGRGGEARLAKSALLQTLTPQRGLLDALRIDASPRVLGLLASLSPG